MQQIRQQQVRGVNGESLADDIQGLLQETKHFDAPVRTKAELPLEGNHDGDIRVVLIENNIYTWDEEKAEWVTKADSYTDNKTKELVLDADGQSVINTKVKVGCVGGMSSLDSFELFVNGMKQKGDRDYVVTIDTDFNCVIEWKSRDFQLEISDTITMSYSILFLS